MELDFHCGSKLKIPNVTENSEGKMLISCFNTVFLTNTSPARCHIHTVNRLPNRGDYGKALIE